MAANPKKSPGLFPLARSVSLLKKKITLFYMIIHNKTILVVIYLFVIFQAYRVSSYLLQIFVGK